MRLHAVLGEPETSEPQGGKQGWVLSPSQARTLGSPPPAGIQAHTPPGTSDPSPRLQPRHRDRSGNTGFPWEKQAPDPKPADSTAVHWLPQVTIPSVVHTSPLQPWALPSPRVQVLSLSPCFCPSLPFWPVPLFSHPTRCPARSSPLASRPPVGVPHTLPRVLARSGPSSWNVLPSTWQVSYCLQDPPKHRLQRLPRGRATSTSHPYPGSLPCLTFLHCAQNRVTVHTCQPVPHQSPSWGKTVPKTTGNGLITAVITGQGWAGM